MSSLEKKIHLIDMNNLSIIFKAQSRASQAVNDTHQYDIIPFGLSPLPHNNSKLNNLYVYHSFFLRETWDVHSIVYIFLIRVVQSCIRLSFEIYWYFVARAIVTFGLNALKGRTINPDGSAVGAWDPSNAEYFLRYTINKGYNIYGWEFGKTFLRIELC